MSSAHKKPASRQRWYLIPFRVLLVTFLITLLSFATSLLLGIVGMIIGSRARGLHPNLTAAYREIAVPTAVVVGGIVLISAIILEVRHYRQAIALLEIERIS